MSPRSSTLAGVNGAIARAPAARRSAPSLRPGALRGLAARFHGNRLLFAGRGVVERRVEALARAFGFAFFALARALEQPCQRRRRRRARPSGRPRGIPRAGSVPDRPAIRMSSSASEEIATVWAWPWPSIQRPRSARPPMRRTSLREVGDRVARVMCAQARLGAQLAQDARDRGEGGAVERVGAVGRHDRVEHERFDVARVGLGVVARRPSCRRRSRTGRAFHSLPPRGSPRCRRRCRRSCRSGASARAAAAHRRSPARAAQARSRIRSRGRRAGARGRCRAGRTRSDRAWRRSARAAARTVRRTGAPPARARRRARSRRSARFARPERGGGGSPA